MPFYAVCRPLALGFLESSFTKVFLPNNDCEAGRSKVSPMLRLACRAERARVRCKPPINMGSVETCTVLPRTSKWAELTDARCYEQIDLVVIGTVQICSHLLLGHFSLSQALSASGDAVDSGGSRVRGRARQGCRRVRARVHAEPRAGEARSSAGLLRRRMNE